MSSPRTRIRHEYELPDDVVEEIITRLPAIHVFRCKFLSKTCYDLIENPRFINKHLRYHSASSNHSNIIRQFSNYRGGDEKNDGIAYLPIRQSDSDADVYIPFPANTVFFLHGSCNGILCAIFYTKQPLRSQIVVWNPATREHKILPPSPTFNFSGFGYDAKTDDYKLVMFRGTFDQLSPSKAVFWSMRSNSWKQVAIWKSVLHLGDSHCLSTTGTFIKGKIYWLVSNKCEHATRGCKTTVLAFDMANDSFDKQIALPDDAPSWARPCAASIVLDFMGSLAFLTNLMPSNCFEYGIWVLKTDDDSGKNYEWAKHFTIGQFPIKVLPTRMISMNGMFLLKELQYSIFKDGEIYFWYDRQSKERRDISSGPLPFIKVPFWIFNESLVSLKQTTVE